MKRKIFFGMGLALLFLISGCLQAEEPKFTLPDVIGIPITGIIEQPEFWVQETLFVTQSISSRSPSSACYVKSAELIGIKPLKICENINAAYHLEGSLLVIDYTCRCFYIE